MVIIENDPIARSLVERVRAAHGAVRVPDLRPTRTERRRLAQLVEAGMLRRDADLVHVPSAPNLVRLARRHRGLLCCASGAAYLGLPVPSWFELPVHLVCRRRIPAGRSVVHVSDRFRPTPAGSPVLPLAPLLAQYLRCAADPVLPLSAVDYALREHKVLKADIASELEFTSGAERARTWLALASPRARSPLETQVRIDLADAGLPYEDGAVVPGVGEVDFIVAGRVVVEADGYTYHSDEWQFARDRERDRTLIQAGFLPLRFTKADICAHRVVEDVRRALAAW